MKGILCKENGESIVIHHLCSSGGIPLNVKYYVLSSCENLYPDKVCTVEFHLTYFTMEDFPKERMAIVDKIWPIN